jgi:adenylosuccinate synthase
MIERGFEALPKNLRSYVRFVEERSRVKASIISIGKERDKTIDRRKV